MAPPVKHVRVEPPPPPQAAWKPHRTVVVEANPDGGVDVVEVTYAGPPTARKVLKRNVPRSVAQYHVRLWLEEWLGPNRYGESGL